MFDNLLTASFKTGVAIAIASLVGSLDQTLPSSSPPNEDFYPPASRTAHNLYTCTDGYRSITLEHGQLRGARFASLSRNGIFVPGPVLEEVNRLVSPLSSVTAIHPNCGKAEDLMVVQGRVAKKIVLLMITWSPSGARLIMSDNPQED